MRKTDLGQGKPGQKIIKSMPLRKQKTTPTERPSMKELTASWNRHGWVDLMSETAQGWLKKSKLKPDDQNRLLRRAVPGARALQEICFYQRCQTFLVSILPFQQLVHEISHICPFVEEGMRWQANALFALQSATEAYMAGFYSDVNECAHHRRVKTINLKDIFLAVSIHGREHIGGHSQVSDVGAANVSVDDSSEKKVAPWGKKKAFAQITHRCAELRAAVAIDTGDDDFGKRGKRGKKGKDTGIPKCQIQWVLKNSIHSILKAAFCQLAD